MIETVQELKDLLQRKKLTTAQLCRIIGSNRQTVQNWLDGKILPSTLFQLRLKEVNAMSAAQLKKLDAEILAKQRERKNKKLKGAE